ncbi:MAG: PEP-CTERM sorting domain-containing protein, partial [Planctomycetota bacterium]
RNARFFYVIFVLSVSTSFCFAANLVTNPGFEISENTDNEYPNTYGNWEGDISEIVTNENGITPLEGSKMLHFIYAAGDYGAHSTIASQVRQIIDVSGYSDMIASGNAKANLSAYFNRILGDAQTDTKFSVRIDAFEGQISNYVNLARDQEQLAYSRGEMFTDSDTSTWEMAATQLLIPTNTDFLAIQVLAIEDVYNDTFGTEFDGHYCDMVTLEIVPEPATLGLLLFGAALLRKRK